MTAKRPREAVRLGRSATAYARLAQKASRAGQQVVAQAYQDRSIRLRQQASRAAERGAK